MGDNCVTYVLDFIEAVVVAVVSVCGEAAGSLIEIAHGSVVDVGNFDVAWCTPDSKGWFVDYLATAYAVDVLRSDCHGCEAFDLVCCSVVVPRLGLSMSAAWCVLIALDSAIGG